MRLQPILGCKTILAKVQEDGNTNILTGRKKEGRRRKVPPKTTKGGRNMRSQPSSVACIGLEAIMPKKFPCLDKIL